MKLVVAVVGRLKDRYLETGIEDYCQRINRYSSFELIRIREETKSGTSPHEEQQAVGKEGDKILQLLRPGDKLIALSEEGTLCNSHQWAKSMEDWLQSTPGRVIFTIGSGLGLAQHVKQRADLLLSLSPLTYPHQLALLLLLEQLYRGFTILHREPYHK